MPLLGGLDAAVRSGLEREGRLELGRRQRPELHDWTMPFSPHWQIGGVFLLGFGSLLIGVVLMIIWRLMRPAFFRGETLNRNSPTLVPDVGDAELAATLAALVTSASAPTHLTPKVKRVRRCCS